VADVRAHRLLAAVEREFALTGAHAVLLAGSRLEQLDYPGADIDFVALYDDPAGIPVEIPHPGAVRMASTMGPSWIGHLDGQEVNVTVLSSPAVRRAAALLGRPLSPVCVPMLQPIEVVTLHRLGHGAPLTGAEYVAGLRDGLHLARLPVAAYAVYHCSAAGHVRTAGALLDRGDLFGFEVMLLAAGVALGIATLCAYGRVGATMKKVATALATLAAEHPDAPLRPADLTALAAGADPRARLALAAAALERSARLAQSRAREDTLWAEARAAITARV
jgi:hypothetical protein